MQHQSILFLPDALRAKGINVVELDGWEENKQGYYWCRMEDGKSVHSLYEGDPNGWMWHHTGTTRYVPYVVNSLGQTKANLWFGLWYDGTLYHEHPDGIPTVVFASAGPANYSSGSGRVDVLTDWVTKDVRFEGPQRRLDDDPKWYGNRFYGNTEIVHPGYGEPLDEGVWEAVVVTGAILSDHFGWSSWRNIGHYDHTRRKVDPRFEQAYPYSIERIQNDIEIYNTEPTMTQCPWTNTTVKGDPWYTPENWYNEDRGPCDSHYTPGNTPVVWGVNTGVCNVPEASWATNAVDVNIAEGVIAPGDNNRDDFDRFLTDGRWWAMRIR